jgi:hypothetical protein
MLNYDDYKKVSKNWNTKTIKTDSTVHFIYKGFMLHKCRDSQWGGTYYNIWNDHNPIFSTSRISGPKLCANDLKDAKKQINDLIDIVSDKSDMGQMGDFDQNLLMRLYS